MNRIEIVEKSFLEESGDLLEEWRGRGDYATAHSYF